MPRDKEGKVANFWIMWRYYGFKGGLTRGKES